jgi:polysaccharide deacetylase family protein (PEP-CTERM system associated)
VDLARFAMTVDVEEWFAGVADHPDELPRFASRLHIGLERILDLLARTGTHATFFVLGYIAEREPSWIREIVRRGHEVAIHGHYHIPLWRLTPREFRGDVTRARRALLDAGAPAVLGYRAPLFSLDGRTTWAYEILEELGFRYSSSVFPMRTPRYGSPRAPRFPFPATASGRFIEFPVSTLQRGRVRLPFCGGFYLRVLPSWALRAAFSRLAEQRRPALCYIHPWELDDQQPSLPVGLLARMRHTIGLRTTVAKLDALLRAFRFTTVQDVLRALSAEPMPAPSLLALRRPAPRDRGTGRRHT